METQETTSPSSESKQITIDVPADRVPEFYAFFAHFLAGGAGRRRRHQGGPHGHRGHHLCGPRRCERTEAETATATQTAGSGTEPTTV